MVEAPSGPPPPVSRYGSVNRFAPVMMASSSTSAVAGRTPGTVTDRKLRHAPAPSTDADSYSSFGTFCSAARYSRMKNPSCFQVTNNAMIGIAQVELTSQTGPAPAARGLWLTSPSERNRNSQTATTATLAVTYGT